MQVHEEDEAKFEEHKQKIVPIGLIRLSPTGSFFLRTRSGPIIAVMSSLRNHIRYPVQRDPYLQRRTAATSNEGKRLSITSSAVIYPWRYRQSESFSQISRLLRYNTCLQYDVVLDLRKHRRVCNAVSS